MEAAGLIMGAPKFTPAAIRRAIAGVREAGNQPAGVEVRPDGSFYVAIVAPGSGPLLPSSPAGEEDVDAWDRRLGTAR